MAKDTPLAAVQFLLSLVFGQVRNIDKYHELKTSRDGIWNSCFDDQSEFVVHCSFAKNIDR